MLGGPLRRPLPLRDRQGPRCHQAWLQASWTSSARAQASERMAWPPRRARRRLLSEQTMWNAALEPQRPSFAGIWSSPSVFMLTAARGAWCDRALVVGPQQAARVQEETPPAEGRARVGSLVLSGLSPDSSGAERLSHIQ